MAFFKRFFKKMGNKWYPQSVTVGKPVMTKEVADRLAQISTVSRSDVYAVLMDLAGVLADFMAQGRSVKIDGLGTFYYTLTAAGQGVESADKVSASQITGVRVRFIPEATRKSRQQVDEPLTYQRQHLLDGAERRSRNNTRRRWRQQRPSGDRVIVL